MEEMESLSSKDLEKTLMYFEEFSKGLNDYSFSGMMNTVYNKYFTPASINQAMQAIGNNPLSPKSEEDIVEALAKPNVSERVLRNYATYFEINNMFYKRLLNFNATLPAWNLTFDCINLEKDEDLNTEDFKKDLKIIDNFCGKFNLKNEFKIILNQILRHGVYYGVFRDEAEICSWQELPSDYCKITGNSNVGKLFSFDFSYFINNAGSNIDMYPKVFKKLLREVWNQIGKKPYNPKGNIDTRHSSFAYWIDLSPKDNFFCFTLNDGLITLIPYYSPLFPEIYIQPMLRKLEKNKAMIAAQKLLVNLLDTYDNAKSGTVTNQYKITPKDIGQFMALVKQALGEVIKAVTIPAKDTKVVDFEVEAQNRMETSTNLLANEAVSSSSSILSKDKLNSFESQLALTIDENFVKGLYGQFEQFLSYYLNKKTNKFKFKFILNDTNTNRDRKNRLSNFKDLAAMGLVDFNLYARATNQNVFEALRSLKFTKSLGLEECLTELKSLNNQSAKSQGRPVSEGTYNDNTMATHENSVEQII